MDGRPRPMLPTVPWPAFALLAALLAGAQVTHQPLDVDENVFISSAALLARESALIYRDFHYNHMPTQTLLFAAMFGVTDHLLLAARLFSAARAVTTATVLFAVAHRALPHLPPSRRLFFASGVGLLLLFDPLFTDVLGKAWNHDLPVLGCLLGFLALARALRDGGRARWGLVAGACLSVAITTRVTFAPTLPAFVLMITAAPGVARAMRLRVLACFGVGGVVAALPTVWVFAQAPEAAFFGNFVYPHLNTRFHIDDRTSRPFTVLGRLWYVTRSLVTLPGNGIVTLGFAALAVVVLRWRAVRRDLVQTQLLCLVALVVSLYAASFAAAPMQRQYLYAPTPFMVLGIALCLGRSDVVDRVNFRRWFAGLVAVAVVCGANEYNGLAGLPRPSSWVPLQVHRDGVELAAKLDDAQSVEARAGDERVLTLYPVYPLEGGLDIYPELATGRFGLRVGKYLPSDDQAAYKMPDVAAVTEWFDSRPPDALLVVWTSPELEKPLRNEAERRNYRLTTLGPKRLLYTRPTPGATVAGVAHP